MDNRASQEVGDIRQVLEKEAFQLRVEGRLVPALEKLEKSMKLGEQWYHLFYKAIWLWDAGKVPEAAKTIEIGVNFEMEKEFFFRVLSADFLFRTAVAPVNASQDLKNQLVNWIKRCANWIELSIAYFKKALRLTGLD